jgi:hypothetical protein
MAVVDLHPEWTLMFGKGLPGALIARTCTANRATVYLHLQRQREADPRLREEHERNRAPRLHRHRPVSRTWLRHFEALKDFRAAHGRMPRSKGPMPGELTLAEWLSRQRTQFRHGRIRPEVLELLGTVQDWNVPARTTADRQRWERRLQALKDFLAREQRWPRYRGYQSGTEHHLGVWLHVQKQKHRNAELPAGYVEALNKAVPGWDGSLRHYVSDLPEQQEVP